MKVRAPSSPLVYDPRTRDIRARFRSASTTRRTAPRSFTRARPTSSRSSSYTTSGARSSVGAPPSSCSSLTHKSATRRAVCITATRYRTPSGMSCGMWCSPSSRPVLQGHRVGWWAGGVSVLEGEYKKLLLSESCTSKTLRKSIDDRVLS